MRYFRSFLSYALLAVASCLGFATVATASETSLYLHLNAVAADSGDYGTQSAKFQVEQTFMAGLEPSGSSANGKMTSESNGFRLASMTKSGVAEGTNGTSPGGSPLSI